MRRIVPTILTDDILEFLRLVKTARTFTDYVQFDIMDGVFAPTRSVTVEQILEARPGIRFEADLMVKDPDSYLAHLEEAGAEEVFFYAEATNMADHIIDEAKMHKLKVGMAILPETPVRMVEPYAGRLDSIRFFSGNLGYYGGEFNEKVLDKVREARAKWPEMIFGIDGGVSLENIGSIAAAGINYFAVGSRIMQKADPQAEYNKFVAAIGGNQ